MPKRDRSLPLRPSLTALALGAFLTAALWNGPARAQSEAETPPESPGQAERIAVGDEAPDFTLTDLKGNPHHLADLRGDKPVVLVFFRGAW